MAASHDRSSRRVSVRVLDRLRVAARGARASLFVARSRRALTVAGVPNCFDPKTAGVQQSGALRKRGGGKSFLGRTNWKQRYFVLSGPFLAYFASKKKYEAGAEPLKEPLCLAGASVRAGDAKGKWMEFDIVFPHRLFQLRADSADVRSRWLAALGKATFQLQQRVVNSSESASERPHSEALDVSVTSPMFTVLREGWLDRFVFEVGVGGGSWHRCFGRLHSDGRLTLHSENESEVKPFAELAPNQAVLCTPPTVQSGFCVGNGPSLQLLRAPNTPDQEAWVGALTQLVQDRAATQQARNGPQVGRGKVRRIKSTRLGAGGTAPFGILHHADVVAQAALQARHEVQALPDHTYRHLDVPRAQASLLCAPTTTARAPTLAVVGRVSRGLLPPNVPASLRGLAYCIRAAELAQAPFESISTAALVLMYSLSLNPHAAPAIVSINAAPTLVAALHTTSATLRLMVLRTLHHVAGEPGAAVSMLGAGLLPTLAQLVAGCHTLLVPCTHLLCAMFEVPPNEPVLLDAMDGVAVHVLVNMLQSVWTDVCAAVAGANAVARSAAQHDVEYAVGSSIDALVTPQAQGAGAEFLRDQFYATTWSARRGKHGSAAGSSMGPLSSGATSQTPSVVSGGEAASTAGQHQPRSSPTSRHSMPVVGRRAHEVGSGGRGARGGGEGSSTKTAGEPNTNSGSVTRARRSEPILSVVQTPVMGASVDAGAGASAGAGAGAGAGATLGRGGGGGAARMGARPAHGRRRKRHRRASISQQASAHDASVFAEFVKQVEDLSSLPGVHVAPPPTPPPLLPALPASPPPDGMESSTGVPPSMPPPPLPPAPVDDEDGACAPPAPHLHPVPPPLPPPLAPATTPSATASTTPTTTVPPPPPPSSADASPETGSPSRHRRRAMRRLSGRLLHMAPSQPHRGLRRQLRRQRRRGRVSAKPTGTAPRSGSGAGVQEDGTSLATGSIAEADAMNRSPSPHVLAVAQPRFGFGSGGRRLRTASRDRGSDARASSGGASGGQDGGGGGGADGGSKEGGSVADSTASTSNASGDSKPPALLPANRRVSSSLKPLPPPPRARSRGTTRARRLFASLSSPRNMLLASSGTSDRDDDKGGGGGGGAGNNGGLTSVGTEGGADVDDQTSFGGSNPMMRNRKLPSQRSTSLRTVTSAERRGSELPVNTDDTSTPPAVVDLRDLFEGVAVQGSGKALCMPSEAPSSCSIDTHSPSHDATSPSRPNRQRSTSSLSHVSMDSTAAVAAVLSADEHYAPPHSPTHGLREGQAPDALHSLDCALAARLSHALRVAMAAPHLHPFAMSHVGSTSRKLASARWQWPQQNAKASRIPTHVQSLSSVLVRLLQLLLGLSENVDTAAVLCEAGVLGVLLQIQQGLEEDKEFSTVFTALVVIIRNLCMHATSHPSVASVVVRLQHPLKHLALSVIRHVSLTQPPQIVESVALCEPSGRDPCCYAAARVLWTVASCCFSMAESVRFDSFLAALLIAVSDEQPAGVGSPE